MRLRIHRAAHHVHSGSLLSRPKAVAVQTFGCNRQSIFEPTPEPPPGETPRQFWSRCPGHEFGFIFSTRYSRIGETLSRIIGSEKRIVNLMCGEYPMIHSELGVDISEGMLAANREVDHKLLFDLNDPSMPLPIADGEFEAAVMISGIAYLDDPLRNFREVSRIVKPGSLFIVGYDHHVTYFGVESWTALNETLRRQRVHELYIQSGFEAPTIMEVPYEDDGRATYRDGTSITYRLAVAKRVC